MLEVLPTFTVPNARLVGDAVNCGTPWPEPLKATVTGEVALLFTRLMLPLAAPTVVGANFAVNVLVCPGVSVRGTVMPLMEKPVPLALAELMVTFAVPGLLSVTVWVALLPTFTLPKLTVEGEADSCATPWPVAVSATVSGDVAVLLTRLTLPLAAPTTVGANVTVKVLVWPGVSVSGTEMPLSVKPVPEIVA